VGVSFFTVNLPIIGAPPGLRAFFRSHWRLHLPGLAAGIVWALGAYSVFLAASAAPQVSLSWAWVFIVPLLAVLVCIRLAASRWKEFVGAPPLARRDLAITAICYAAGLAAAGLAVRS
jgi:branched-subunit amino acid ABC-type transport system permease component